MNLNGELMFAYNKLWNLLKSKNLKKIDLKTHAGITAATLAKLGKNESVSLDVLNRVCVYLECDIGDIMEHVYTPYRDDDTLGTFIPNKKEIIHNWFSYLEGYSKNLVESELEKLDNVRVVLDPFGGSGTTPLVSVLNGIDAYYTETNPAMVFVTKCKTEIVFKIAHSSFLTEKFNYYIKEFQHDFANTEYQKKVSLNDFGGFEKYFEPENLFYIQKYQQFYKKIEIYEIRSLFQLALISVAVSTSKMVRRGDLRYAKGKEILKTNKPFMPEVISKLITIRHDILKIDVKNIGKAIFLCPDARMIKEENLADVIITSPPYLNGTNYIRNTKLELKLLEIVNTEKELALLHKEGIVAGINNVTKGSGNFKPINEVLDIIEQLEVVSYDKRISQMIGGYFNDMDSVFEVSSKVLKDEGYFIMDIGDSQFAGVHVPTHEILIGIAAKHGFKLYENEIIRKRKSKSGFELTQRILRFKLKK